MFHPEEWMTCGDVEIGTIVLPLGGIVNLCSITFGWL